MNDDDMFRRLAAHAGSAEVDPGFDDRLYGLLRSEVGRSRRSTSTVLLIAAGLLLALAVGSAILVASGLVEPPVLPQSSMPLLAYEVDGEIFLADANGGNPVRVTDDVAANGGDSCGGGGGEGTMWAPDGRHFAFRSGGSDECPGEVHVLDADGRLVASVPGFGWDVHWSPDSTRFATWIDFWETIAIYDLEGERLALLPACGQRSGDHDPRFSLDGRSIVVPNCEIPIDGGDPELDPGYRDVYSPDGTRVAQVTRSGDSETFDSSVVIAEADGTVLQVVHEASSPSPWYDNLVWSPSGERLLFSRIPRTDAGGLLDATAELRQVDLGTGQVTTIGAKSGIRPIRFSPDGDRILFATWDGSQPGAERYTGLWSMDADGSHMQLLVPDTGRGDWQPQPGSD